LQQGRYYVSAFLNAVRSPQQYMLERWKSTPARTCSCKTKYEQAPKAWYDGEVSKYPVLKFIAEERNVNIHVTPAQPMAHITFFSIVARHGEPEIPTSTTCHQEWNFNGTDRKVCELAEEAIAAVRQFVADGKALGHIPTED